MPYKGYLLRETSSGVMILQQGHLITVASDLPEAQLFIDQLEGKEP